MNPRIQKITDEVDKLKRKVVEYQTRIKELEKQKTEMENNDIIAMVRDVGILPEQFAEFARMFKEQQGGVLPDVPVEIADKKKKEDVDDKKPLE